MLIILFAQHGFCCKMSIIIKVNRKFKDLDYSVLLDRLAQHTAEFTQLLNENGSAKEKEECRQLIQRFLAEINIREREGETKDPADKIIN